MIAMVVMVPMQTRPPVAGRLTSAWSVSTPQTELSPHLSAAPRVNSDSMPAGLAKLPKERRKVRWSEIKWGMLVGGGWNKMRWGGMGGDHGV